MIRLSASTQKQKKHGIQTKKIPLFKDPRYNLRSLATVAEDVLHVYGGHEGGRGGGKAANQLHLLCLPGMIEELGRHLMEVLAGIELEGGEGDPGSLPGSGHHRAFTVLH
jgi:hypothetical protein